MDNNWYNAEAQKMYADFEKRKEDELFDSWQNEYYKKARKSEDDILFRVLIYLLKSYT